jgi:hypothetical protein
MEALYPIYENFILLIWYPIHLKEIQIRLFIANFLYKIDSETSSFVKIHYVMSDKLCFILY